jgi:hypothetical protein
MEAQGVIEMVKEKLMVKMQLELISNEYFPQKGP